MGKNLFVPNSCPVPFPSAAFFLIILLFLFYGCTSEGESINENTPSALAPPAPEKSLPVSSQPPPANPPAPAPLATHEFTIQASPAAVVLSPGNTTETTVNIIMSSGPEKQVSLSQTSCPTGATCTFSVSSGSSNYSSTFHISLPPGIPSGIYSITLTASSDSLTKSTLYVLNVTSETKEAEPASDFLVSVSPGSGGVLAGATISPLVTVLGVAGTPHAVSLSSSGCPHPSVCTFSQPIGDPTYSSSFTVGVPSSLEAGTYLITIMASGAGISRSTVYSLTVTQPQFDFSLSLGSLGTSITVNSTGTLVGVPITLSLINGSAKDAMLSYANCPPSASCTLSQPTGAVPYSSAFNVSLSDATPAGSYQIALTGTSGSATRSKTFTLNVSHQAVPAPPFNFSLSLSSSATMLSSINGSSPSDVVTVSLGLISATTQSVALSQSGCPTGATCTFNISSGTPAFSSLFNVTITNSTLLGTYPINISAASVNGTLRSAIYSVTVS